MKGSQYHLNQYQINFQTLGSSPKKDNENLQENLERLSQLLANNQADFRHKALQQPQDPVKKVFVNLRGFLKPQSANAQNLPLQASQVRPTISASKPSITIKSGSNSKIFTPQTQTPITLHEPSQSFKKPFLRPQSMASFEKYLKPQEKSYQDTTNQQSERMNELSKLLGRDINKSSTRTYQSWVGLSVVERNRIFLERKQQKLARMREQKEEEELNKCPFSPQFYNQIKVERPSSLQANKSYQDIYRMKKSSTLNDQLY